MKLRLRQSESGSALVLTIVTSGILGMSIATYLGLVNAQYSAVKRSQQFNMAIPVVEAGIEEALTHLNVDGQTNLASNGWTLSNGAYRKTRAMNTDYYYTASISNVNPPVVFSAGFLKIPGKTNYMNARSVMVNVVRNGLFKGMVAKSGVTFNGGITVDSFDSSDSNYSTGGAYVSAKNKDNGYVGAVLGSIDVGANGKIYGSTGTGPTGTVSNGVVGDKAYIALNSSGIESGHYNNDLNLSFPDVTLPFAIGTNINQANYSGTLGGTNYTLLFTNGNYQLNTLSTSGQGKVAINGNVTLLVTNGFSMAGQSFIYITPGSTLKVYVMAGSTSLAGNGIMNGAGNALNFQYFGMPNNTSLSLSGNAAFTGVIYAPSAAFSMNGGGNNNYDCVGASITASVTANGHFNFHYDENIGKTGPSSGWTIWSWNEI